MAARFPTVEAEDFIQETFISMIRIFPVYHYDPQEKGPFHNYLTGVLRRKVQKELLRRARQMKRLDAYAEMSAQIGTEEDQKADEWRQSVCKIALQQLLGENSVQGRTKQVFIRVAVNGESPQVVADAFGMTRNAVDQIRSRLLRRLRELAICLEQVEEG